MCRRWSALNDFVFSIAPSHPPETIQTLENHISASNQTVADKQSIHESEVTQLRTELASASHLAESRSADIATLEQNAAAAQNTIANLEIVATDARTSINALQKTDAERLAYITQVSLNNTSHVVFSWSLFFFFKLSIACVLLISSYMPPVYGILFGSSIT